MRSLVITFIIVLCTASASAQFFEGKIVYHNTYVSRTPGTSDKQYNTMLGDIQTFYIKQGNYKYDTNGTFLLWQLYINKENKLYSKIAHSGTVLWDDPKIDDDKITSVEVRKNAATVLGYACDEVILHYESNYHKYYFSTKLGVDSKLFSKHLYNGWYPYLAKANAIPLKMSFRTKKYVFESVATQITPTKLNDGFFTLPPQTKTEKSMF